jgi:hypothetical protein
LWLSNPFDESLTTNWTDVRESVADLVWFSDIMNLSLGLPGWTFNDGWAEVLSHSSVRDMPTTPCLCSRPAMTG